MYMPVKYVYVYEFMYMVFKQAYSNHVCQKFRIRLIGTQKPLNRSKWMKRLSWVKCL